MFRWQPGMTFPSFKGVIYTDYCDGFMRSGCKRAASEGASAVPPFDSRGGPVDFDHVIFKKWRHKFDNTRAKIRSFVAKIL